MKNIILFIVLLGETLLIAQNKENIKKEIMPPIAVKTSFKNEFKNLNPIWTSDYEGYENEEERYIATFNSTNSKFSAYYDNKGRLRVIEQSIKINNIPTTILKYLKDNYPIFTINDAVIIKDDKKKEIYEIGIGNSEKFFVAQFDNTGYFLQIVKKK